MDLKKAIYEKFGTDTDKWDVKGLINEKNQIFTLGSDSKLIGRIFELITAGFLHEIAEENDYELVPSISQTVYPDFNLIKKNKKGDIVDLIAIDVKTTYRRYDTKGNVSNFGFTLGSFASFMRDNTKNIQYPYDCYSKHYVLGFIYDRSKNSLEKIVNLSEINKIITPYENVEFFVEEKYKIAGEKPGSGNTENIGSVKSKNAEIFYNGAGPFSVLGEEIFDHYWSNYPKYRAPNKNFTNLSEYFNWLENEKENKFDFTKLKEKYESWLKD